MVLLTLYTCLCVSAYHSIYQVQGGEAAIIWNRVTGISDTTKDIGMHFRIPFVDYPIIFDVRTRPRNVQTLTGSKDLQMVSITLRVLTRPEVSWALRAARPPGASCRWGIAWWPPFLSQLAEAGGGPVQPAADL